MSNILHNRIAVLRAERNLSRQDLATALGINYQTIGFLERGDYNPSLSLALDLSEYFALPIEALFSRKSFPLLSTAVYGSREVHAAEAPANAGPSQGTAHEPARKSPALKTNLQRRS